jgi:hypothetical protein
VQSALGLRTNQVGTNLADQITLEEMPFTDQFTEVAKDMTRQQQINTWWGYGQNGLLMLLAVGIFAAFWRMWKKTPLDGIQIGVPLSEMDAEESPMPAAPRGAQFTTPEPVRSRSSSQPVLSVEVFNQLVRENPDNMSQAIQNWLAQGRSSQN